MANNLLRSLALVGAVAFIPATTASLAQVDANSYREIDQFMSVLERVKAEYVDQVDDATLIRGAIDGMLNSLDPHSSYLDERGFSSLMTTTDGNYGGLGLTVTMEDGAVKVIAADRATPPPTGPASSRATSSPISTAGCSTAARSTRRSTGCAALRAPACASPSSGRAAIGRSTSASPARSSTFRRCARKCATGSASSPSPPSTATRPRRRSGR